MKNLKFKNVAWGLFFIISGTLIILNQTGLLLDLSLWSLIIGLLLVPVFATAIRHLSFPGIFFPVALWAILYAEPLGIEKFTPWPVLGAALFLSIGLSIMFPKKHGFSHSEVKHDNSEDWIPENITGECIKINTRFSGASKYLNSEDFQSCEINCSFGGMKVFFDNAQIQGDSAHIHVNIEFSGVEIFVPADWNIVCNVDNKLSGIDEKGNTGAAKSGKNVYLSGNIAFGGLTIRYV